MWLCRYACKSEQEQINNVNLNEVKVIGNADETQIDECVSI